MLIKDKCILCGGSEERFCDCYNRIESVAKLQKEIKQAEYNLGVKYELERQARGAAQKRAREQTKIREAQKRSKIQENSDSLDDVKTQENSDSLDDVKNHVALVEYNIEQVNKLFKE